MRNSRPGGQRRGIATLWLLIVLAILTVLFTMMTKELLLHRKALDGRAAKLQAVWLARAGVELAAGRLLDKADGHKEEIIELAPHGKVRIEVKAVKGQAGVFEVSSEGRFPAEDPKGARELVTRRFRRVVEGEHARLVPEPGP